MTSSFSEQHTEPGRLHTIFIAAGIAGLWLLCRPYLGIWHDGILYAGQALKILFPLEFSNELFFRFGSQDDYSGFSRAYAWLIAFAGTDPASRTGVLACAFFFACASCALFRPILKQDFLLWAGLASVAVFAHFYGSNRMFSFTEQFLTARNAAEPLAVLALALFYRNRPALALISLLLAAWMHPLIALPAVVAGWVWLSLRDSRYWWGACLGLIPVAAALAGVAPFTSLFHSFDAEWLAPISLSYVFLANWHAQDFIVILYDIVILVFSAFLLRGDERKICVSVIVTALSGLVAVLVFSDLLGNVLLTQIQPWRALWLLRFFSLMLTPLVVVSMYRSSLPGRYAALSFFVAACSTVYISCPIALALGVGLWWKGRQDASFRLSKSLRYILIFATFAAITLDSFRYLRGGFGSTDIFIALRSLFFAPALAALAACGMLWLIHKKKWPAMMLLSVCLLSLGIFKWDVSRPMRAHIDNGMKLPHLAMRERIAPTQLVYWEGSSIAVPWLTLQRSVYFSERQRAGLLFSRGAAIEFAVRRKKMAAVIEQEEACQQSRILSGNYAEPCKYDMAALKKTCERARELDFMAFEQEFPGQSEAVWEIPGDDGNPVFFHLYSCRRLRGEN